MWKPYFLRDEVREKSRMYRVKAPIRLAHRAGLPIADGAMVEADMCGTRRSADADSQVFVFSDAAGNAWTLPKSKVCCISLMTEKEVQTHFASRPGMALGGAVLAGIPGAIVGGAMTKRKDAVLVDRFVVFDYLRDGGGQSSLVFQWDDYMGWDAHWSIKDFVKDFEGNRGEYAPPQSHTL